MAAKHEAHLASGRTSAELEAELKRLAAERDEALAREAAMTEVLGVINSSPGDLAPVFDAMLEKARALGGVAFGTFMLREGERFYAGAVHGAVPEPFARILREGFVPSSSSPVGRLLAGEAWVHIPDLAAILSGMADDPVPRAAVEAGVRTLLMIPLVKDGELIGLFTNFRQEVRPFTDKQIALLQNFAAQAVIAMENARLLTETRDALEQQTATAEVLGVINSSPGNLQPVFEAMLDKAMRLCGVDHAALELYDGERMHAAAVLGASDRFGATLRAGYRAIDHPAARALLEGQCFVEVADAKQVDHIAFRTAAEVDGIGTVLFVPLRRDDLLLGMIAAARRQVHPFTDKEIVLLQNFAAQAVIAMENARLISETREALEQQTATAEVLGVINSSPGDLKPVFDAVLEKAMHFCGASFGILRTLDGALFHTVAAHGVPAPYGDFLIHNPQLPAAGTSGARILGGEPVVHIVDLVEAAHYRAGEAHVRALVELGGARTALTVPLTKEGSILGAFQIYRQEVRAFTDKQIALLQNFAAQAVIAMENARLITETREALEQQTATADVLGVINASPGDLAPVFDAMLDKSLRLCEATFGGIATYDGEFFHQAASRDEPQAFQEARRAPWRPGPQTATGRLVRGEALVHTPDVTAEEIYLSGDPHRRSFADLTGARTCIWVALRKDDKLLGFIAAYRTEVRPFSDQQIALLQNFAAQAVIAMENARLLTETREALEQQTATAEVLGVINSSPGNLAPVFDAMLEKAAQLCNAPYGQLAIYDGGMFKFVAAHGEANFAAHILREPHPPSNGITWLRILGGENVVHIPDARETELYHSGHQRTREFVEKGGGRSLLSVALRKDNALLGILSIYRQEPQPFSDKQIALLQNFAQQAVIAMENARLLTETREALEQQTATAEVLQVINASPGHLAPVFDAMLEKAMRLCEAAFGHLDVYDGERFETIAVKNVPASFAEFRSKNPPNYGPGTGPARMLAGERVFQHLDVKDEDVYRSGEPNRRALVDLGGARSVLQVALVKEQTFLGFLTLCRQEVRSFTDKQIALLQNFAQQAVIAMENARLLTETREALEQQTATAEVLQVINSSPGDLEPVFEVILQKAHDLCGAVNGALFMRDGERFRPVALHAPPEPIANHLRQYGLGPDAPAVGPLLDGARFVHIPDMRDIDHPDARAAAASGVRAILSVPLRKDGLVGTINAVRFEVRPFSDNEIALLESFAAQAVIAIENARLLGELRQRTRDLQESLDYQTATSDVLKVISQSTFDLQPVLETVAETAARLCASEIVTILRRHADGYRVAAAQGWSLEYREFLENHTFAAEDQGALTGRVVLERRAVQIADITADPTYKLTEAATLGKARTQLGVPLLREGAPIGVIIVSRQRVEPFTQKQIELVTTFADQAVIAMENARLLGELRERTDEVVELNRGLEARVSEQVEELGRVGRLKRFLAPQLAELIVSQGDEKILESHRREIVVVFCDLRGYTAFTETAEPEEVLDFLREYHGALGPLVSQFEGTLDQFSGDGIMVFFNDPVPIPDPAERAVKMAMAMREAAGVLIAAWRERGRELGFGAGIAQGYATLGQIGFSERSGYTAIGTVCNVAARLCAEAKDGQILLSQRVNVALKDSVATEQVGALTLKGLTQPVVAYNVPLAVTQPALRVIKGGPQSV